MIKNLTENQSPAGQLTGGIKDSKRISSLVPPGQHHFSDSIFSLSKRRPCSIASDTVLNFLFSNEDPVLSCTQARIFGCNVMDTLSRFTSFNNFVISTYKNAKKHINIVNNITYKSVQERMKADEMNEWKET